jgi:hypothetical protein
MGENTPLPVQPSVDRDDSDALNRVPVAGLSSSQINYPLETLEVRSEGQNPTTAKKPVTPVSPQSVSSAAAMRSVPFSRRRAVTVSLVITMIIVLFTGGVLAILVKSRFAEKQAAGRDVPTQGVTLVDPGSTDDVIELKKEQQSLLVSGDIITRGEIQVSSGGGYVTVLRGQSANADQILVLPNTSGEICTNSNNCNFATESALDAVQGQIVAATTVNGQSGDVVLQGTANQISVSTSGNIVTFTTPQSIHTAASVQFAQLQLSGVLRVNSITPTLAGGSIIVNAASGQVTFMDRGRTFAFPTGGLVTQTICTSQNNCNYGTGNGDIVNGGQIGPIVIGTDDASTLAFETNNTQRIILQSSGNVAIDTTTLTIDAVNNRVGVGTVTPSAKLEVSGGSLLVTGTHTGAAEITVTGDGTRMFFDVGRSTFRAGKAVGNSWDPSGGWYGEHSAAFGQNTRASQWGFAAGQSTRAGTQAVAFGASSWAMGWQSSAFGASTRANGQHSMATGVCNVDRADLTSTPTATDALFMIGNGTDSGLGDGSCSSRSDAFTVLRNGSTTVNGGSLLVQGTHGGGNGNTVTGPGTRMFFDVNKSAFRAGSVSTGYWDDANIGNYSFAAGRDVQAFGSSSVALGLAAIAGWDRSFAAGTQARTNGIDSFALGPYVQSNSYASTALGVCNVYSGGDPDAWVATDQLLSIGNGVPTAVGGASCNSRTNALEIAKNGNLAVDTNTFFIDAVNNRIGIGTATPMSKLEVVESSTDTTAASISGATITVTDTGVVTTGTDSTSGLSVSVTRTGATGGTIQVIGGSFNAVGDTGGNSVAVGVQGLGANADDSVGVLGYGFISGSGVRNSTIGVNGVTGTYFAGGTTTASAYGLQGSISMDIGAATITNAAGLNVKSATNTAGGTITNNYGIRVENQTAGVSDYGLYIEGADTYALWVDSGATRLDGTLQGYGHAAFGADALIDGTSLTSGFLDGSSLNNVVTIAEEVIDFSKDITTGQAIFLHANPTSAYAGIIMSQGTETLVGGSQSVENIMGQVNMTMTKDSVNVNDALVGQYNTVTHDSTGTAGGVFGELNSVQVIDGNVTNSIIGSINSLMAASDTPIVIGGQYLLQYGGTATNVAGLQAETGASGTIATASGAHVSLITGTGTITTATGTTISLQSQVGSTVATAVGLDIAATTHLGAVTDSYGLRVGGVSGATNSYGLYVEGADTYALWVDDGVSRLDGNLEVDTDTLFVDATTNRVGVGTAAPASKLHVVESSTDGTAGTLTGAFIQVTDTGAVSSGYDITAGLAVNVSRTGATGGSSVTNGAHFASAGDTGGDSLVQGVNAWAYGGDNSTGVNGSATVSGSGAFASIVGVQGSASVYFASDAAVTDAIGLQGSVSNGSSAAYTNGVGLNIKAAVNSGLGSITNNYGLRVENQTAGTSNYGLYIEGASTYGIWVDSGVSRFDGNVGINTASAPNRLNLNTLTTADVDAQLAVSSGGTLNKGVVVQGVASQIADLFQAQDSTGAVLASISATGDLTVETATINGTLTVNGNATINGHVISGNSSGSTTVAVDTAAGTGAAASIDGNDTAGTITIDTGTAATTGSLVTITFAQSYANAPRVVVTAADSDGSLLGYFVTGVTTTGFTIDVSSAPADTTELLYNYHVIE